MLYMLVKNVMHQLALEKLVGLAGDWLGQNLYVLLVLHSSSTLNCCVTDSFEIGARWITADVCCVGTIDYYDQTDAVSEQPTPGAEVEIDLTETDNPERVPSYGDFLIAYPTQSCELTINR